jgi:hypothetical protein
MQVPDLRGPVWTLPGLVECHGDVAGSDRLAVHAGALEAAATAPAG